METREQIIQMLKDLFTVCRTAEISYRAAAEAVESKTTRELLRSYSDQRVEFADELRAEIRFHSDSDFDAVPPADSWIEIRQAIRDSDEQQVIHACAEAEEAMLRVYENALAKRIPWDVESVLAHQYSEIKQAFYFVNALELFSHQFVV